MEKEIEGLQSKYKDIQVLNSQESPQEEPFKYKYQAIDIYKSTILFCDNYATKEAYSVKLELLKSACLCHIGMLLIETEDLPGGEKALTKSLNILDGVDVIELHAILKLQCLINLGMLWSMRDMPEKSLELFLQAEHFYHSLGSLSSGIFWNLCDYFTLKDISDNDTSQNAETIDTIEKHYTHVMYYLAQVYGTVGQPFKAARYCHGTLERQIKVKDYDPIEWSVNAATLSQYFTSEGQFVIARNHLACAEHVLAAYGLTAISGEPEKSNRDEDTSIYTAKKSHIARLWLKYGIALLKSSQCQIISDDNNFHNSEVSNIADFLFSDLPVRNIEDQVTAQYVRVYPEARLLFLNCQKWFKQASQYYTLDEFASDAVQISQDFCEAYKYLAVFEDDLSRQCKMHKRRIDIMENLLKQLNPEFYFLMCQQLHYDAAEAYSTMVNIKLAIIERGHAVQRASDKVAALAEKGITHFQTFIDSYNDNKTSNGEAKFSEEVTKIVMVAYFRLGLLYSKMTTPNDQDKAGNLKKSLEHYKYIVNYCKKHETVAKQLEPELEMCEEMIQLLPARISLYQKKVDKS